MIGIVSIEKLNEVMCADCENFVFHFSQREKERKFVTNGIFSMFFSIFSVYLQLYWWKISRLKIKILHCTKNFFFQRKKKNNNPDLFNAFTDISMHFHCHHMRGQTKSENHPKKWLIFFACHLINRSHFTFNFHFSKQLSKHCSIWFHLWVGM